MKQGAEDVPIGCLGAMRAVNTDAMVGAKLAPPWNPHASIEVAVSSLTAANADGLQPSGYQVDDLIIDLGRRSVSRGGVEIPFPALSFDMLLALVRAAPNLLSHDQLMAQVWQGVVVNSETISQRVKLVRDALGDEPSGPRYIAGVRGKGYRLLPAAMPIPPSEEAPSPGNAPGISWRPGRLVAAIGVAVLMAVAGLSVLSLRSKPATTRDTATPPSVLVISVPRSIAVLPFVYRSADASMEYLAEGLAEELRDVLLQFPELTVIGRTSSISFKNRDDDVRTIASSMGATHLLEGAVQLSGDRIRFYAQLIDARSGVHLWSGSYDHGLVDIPELPEEVAGRVGHALRLTAGVDPARSRKPPPNAQAYALFLRGRATWVRGDAVPPEASTFFQQALRLDPEFARAPEALALVHATSASWPAATDAARRTLQLDPKSALAHAILGTERACVAYDWTGANAQLDEALASKPREPAALAESAWLAFMLARHNEALRLQDAALASDPLNSSLHQGSAWMRLYRGDLDGADREFQTSLQLSPSIAGSHFGRGLILLLRQQPATALAEMQAEPVRRDEGLALVYHALGREVESDAALARLAIRGDRVEPCDLASGYAYRNQSAHSLEWLEKCIARRDRTWVSRIQYDPMLASLRPDPRFKALLRRVNLDVAPGLAATAAPPAPPPP